MTTTTENTATTMEAPTQEQTELGRILQRIDEGRHAKELTATQHRLEAKLADHIRQNWKDVYDTLCESTYDSGREVKGTSRTRYLIRGNDVYELLWDEEFAGMIDEASNTPKNYQFARAVWKVFTGALLGKCPDRFNETIARKAWLSVTLEMNGIGEAIDSPPRTDTRPEFANLADLVEQTFRFASTK